MAEVAENEPELLPVEKYMRAVSICNNLALLASQGTMIIFVQRLKVLKSIESCWTKGHEAQLLYEHLEDPDDSTEDNRVMSASRVPIGNEEMTLAMNIVDVKVEPEMTSGDRERLLAMVKFMDDHESDDTIVENEPRAMKSSETDEEGVKAEYTDDEWRPAAKKGKKTAKKLHEKPQKEKRQSRGRKSLKEAREKPAKRRPIIRRSETKSKAKVEDEEMAIAETGAAAECDAATSSADQAAFSFICSICKLSFTTFVEMRDHKLAIHGIRAYKPSAAMGTKDSREQPRISSKAGCKRVCPLCNQVFCNMYKLKRHLNSSSHSGEGSLVTSGDDLQIRNDPSLISQTTVDMDEKSVYLDSGEEIEEQSTIADHIRPSSQRKCTTEKAFCCSICGATFRNGTVLKYHIYKHTGELPFECSLCHQTFSQRSKLSQHMSLQHRMQYKKSALCSVCGLRLKDSTYLKRHLMVHNGAKPYDCNYCGQQFRQHSTLVGHVRAIHSGEKPYMCAVCGASFIKKNLLNYHCNKHTGERPYACSMCDRAFARPDLLHRHKKIHSSIKYSCSLCDKAYTQPYDLRAHLKTHGFD